MVYVVKKDGSKELWSNEKIIKAVELANRNTNESIDCLDLLLTRISNRIDCEEIHVHDLHEVVIQELDKLLPLTSGSYKMYRSMRKIFKRSQAIVNDGDKENANRDSSLNATKVFLIGTTVMSEMMDEFVLPKKWVNAHKEGYIHIHDKSERFVNSKNCCLFDLGNVMKGGFELNGIKYEEPNTVRTAWNIAGDVVLSVSSNQYGGFTTSQLDKVFAPYAAKTYQFYKQLYLDYGVEYELSRKMAKDATISEIKKGYKGFETKICTIGNSLAQTPFTTISFGLDTSYWGRVVSRCILEQRMEGIGTNKQTPIFPKIVFLHADDINGNTHSPNYDLKLLALECSKTRLYPDFLAVDKDNSIGKIYKESGQAITPMGCRAFLGEFRHPETNELIVEGRANVGAITLNLPLLALSSNKSTDKFFRLIDEYSELVFDIHNWTYNRLATAKGSSNPLFYCEGGAWTSVGYHDSIEPVVKGFTASLGFIGLEETCQALFGKPLKECEEFAKEVMDYLWSKVEEYKKRDGWLYTLYSTPAESLIYRFQNINRDKFGEIKNVTDRLYMTNSFHQGVWHKHNPVTKMNLESPLFNGSHGGRIVYCEYPYNIDTTVLEQCVDYGMSKGLYQGINIESANCNDCGHQGEFEICPKCGSDDVNIVDRCCGYLSFKKVKGETRYNEGKMAEIKDRVIHIEGYSRGNEQGE